MPLRRNDALPPPSPLQRELKAPITLLTPPHLELLEQAGLLDVLQKLLAPWLRRDADVQPAGELSQVGRC